MPVFVGWILAADREYMVHSCEKDEVQVTKYVGGRKVTNPRRLMSQEKFEEFIERLEEESVVVPEEISSLVNGIKEALHSIDQVNRPGELGLNKA